MDTAYNLLDQGYIPDRVLRPVIRQLCRRRLREIDHGSVEKNHAAKMAFIKDLQQRPIAIEQAKANEQHYEVPSSFLQLCLGPKMKYSSCIFPTAKTTLDEAEVHMLSSYCTEAHLGVGLNGVGSDEAGHGVEGKGGKGKEGEGLKILDLGCGWGSLGLFLAEHYPHAEVTMLSNSRTQKIFIDGVAKDKGFNNVTVITGDVNTYDFEEKAKFTHVMSIEMFEHMKGYGTLTAKVASWLQPGGRAFIHVFCHKDTPYHFEEDDGWMAKNFFTGGTMPSLDLFAYFQQDLTLVHSTYLNGTHYARTLEAWLKLQDSHSKEALKILTEDGGEEGRKTFYRFRVFFMACAEFFALDGGETWGIGRYLFRKATN